ncbi:unnamed protein product [Parascedosporium putredinis]|uniref:Major facilitator superfamily (MFS) profile domain-containing protein n=1 Tax=Parascedosporium putredinis TaxID=1442378 RepID=A0A9P1HC62_9PEZI|nr:unnamed protein product [Parascedosporium putredinis]CAI8004403.1 unnamed protein product [Parascedosporium putredinis]
MAHLLKHHRPHDPPMGVIPGTYWADLPVRQRVSFVHKVQSAEAKSEAKSVWRMMREDPLSPLGWYVRNAVLPGAGLGLEGYVLFSIGNLEPLFKATWPECWGKDPTVCSPNWIASVTYLEVIGIMVGQIGVGFIGDWIGRRWGLIQDAVIMFVGLLMLTASWGLTLQGWVICYAWSLFFYGFGVGGEYPITATSSMENAVSAGKLSTREDRLHRGRKVTMAFLMQGWGQLVNQGLLMILLLCFHHGSGNPLTAPSPPTRDGQAPQQRDGLRRRLLKIACRHFGGRLLATAGTWFCNDVFFYGNKLFQGQFIGVISPAAPAS